ncbi:MAG: flagellar hook-length control protein FliK [Butyrivibrio sp.]|uniref:flagellar hook-length control protein FliK n=1 Tax=Butyrivibrio sp. TaxID=28121 RepID=UPI001B01A393|nr:flagellar hook-length control protein FliK [Butyrivibrio sp.]MBO6239929.1 flagellar hook-length control protein FliK [Butyrivibrio sp.]
MSGISNVSQSNLVTIQNGSLIQGKEVSEQPLNLKNGSVIQGTIVSILDTDNGKMVNINVSGNEIAAFLRDEMNLREGQTMQFAVKGQTAKAISIMPLFENTATFSSAMKALSEAGLENTPENLNMVREMMEAQLPIDKGSLQEMNRNMNLFPESPISTLVEMKSLNIPITDNNIKSFESYKNYEHQVVAEMEDIMDSLPDSYNTLISNGEETKALNLYGAVLKAFGGEISKNTGEFTYNSPAVSANSPEITEGLNNPNVKAQTTAQTPAQINAQTPVKELGQEVETMTFELTAQEDGVILESAGKNVNSNRAYSSEFIDTLRNLGVSEEIINKLNTSDSKELFRELAVRFENSDLQLIPESASWKKLFSSEEFGKILKENIEGQWLLKPDEVEDKENINNLYQRLGNQVKHLAEAVNNVGHNDSKLGQSLNSLSNNLDFMNQLNHLFQYVQLPLQMAGQNVHGDLYVYRNKNKRMSEDGSVSAVLHLDMDNLGPIDVYVKLLEKKVTTNFYVADEMVLDLINDNIHILDERLQKRGYTMNVSLKLHDDIDGDDAAVDEMFEVAKTPLISTTSFDARA